MAWYGVVWYGMVWYGMGWYVMGWDGMPWYGMVWHDMASYGIVHCSHRIKVTYIQNSGTNASSFKHHTIIRRINEHWAMIVRIKNSYVHPT